MGQRAQEDEFRDIADYLQGLQFKKVLYGVKAEEAYTCMKELDAMYKDILEEYKESLSEELDERKLVIEELEEKVETVLSRLTKMQKIKEADQEKIRELENLIVEKEREEQEYKEKAGLLADTLTDTQKNKSFILEQAKREARAIVYEAKQEAGRIILESRDQARDAEERSRAMLEEIGKLRQKAGDGLNQIKIDLQDMSSGIVKLQRKIDLVPHYITPVKMEMGHFESSENSGIMSFEQHEVSKK